MRAQKVKIFWLMFCKYLFSALQIFEEHHEQISQSPLTILDSFSMFLHSGRAMFANAAARRRKCPLPVERGENIILHHPIILVTLLELFGFNSSMYCC